MQTPRLVQANQWVRVCKGLYKGDIGFVVSVAYWGADVLLVPRLHKQATGTVEHAPPAKRKRSTIPPEPALLDPDVLENVFNIVTDPYKEMEVHYTLRGLKFEYGLLRKAFDFHSIAIGVSTIPSRHFNMFQLSYHPIVNKSRFPRPLEWIFEEDERVVILSSGKKGVVMVIAPFHIEVELEEGETWPFPWNDVRKVVEVGDFITVTSGMHRGVSGFVDTISDPNVNFYEEQDKSAGMEERFQV